MLIWAKNSLACRLSCFYNLLRRVGRMADKVVRLTSFHFPSHGVKEGQGALVGLGF